MSIFTSAIESFEPIARQTKVRKGTHSCRECRRRKVKCIFESPSDTVCIMCTRRETACISQADISPPQSNTPASISSSVRDRHLTGTADSSRLPTPTPTPDGASTAGSQLPPDSNMNIRQEMLRALPSIADIEILARTINMTSATSYQCSHRTRYGWQALTPDRQKDLFTISSMLRPEKHPILLANHMLLMAMAMQDLSPNITIPGLSRHHHAIMDDLVTSASRMVISNDSLIGSLEGLENIILEGCYHCNRGNVRRGWICIRRAVMVAQLLCLHRIGSGRFTTIDEQCNLDPELMWINIVYMERVVSLMLGLPTSTGNLDLTRKHTANVHEESYWPLVLGNVAAKIIERNQIEDSQLALDLTSNIDKELVGLADNMSPSFWRPAHFTGLTQDSVEAYTEIKRALTHCVYYILVIQLHLPHTLTPNPGPQNVYSKLACVNASREILTREIALRTFNPVAACFRLSDFMAPIAGMTLMLAHAVSHCGKNKANFLVHQRLSDRALVARALECMNFMTELQDDLLAVKCVALLKDLLAIEEDAAREQKRGTTTNAESSGDQGHGRDMFIMRVPFVGGINISKRGVAAVAPVRPEQDQSDGLNIGGIGSIHVTTSRRPSDHTASQHARLTTSHSMPQPTSEHEICPAAATCVPDNPFPPQEQMFPDAAANMSDWAFQGMDTAFFESLMRGAGDISFDETMDPSDESWANLVNGGHPKTPTAELLGCSNSNFGRKSW